MKLLERETSLSDLEEALKEAIAGEGRVALVSGEAGIGKTSLNEQFVREQRASVRVFWGTCDALFTPRPLGPLHDIAMQAKGELLRILNSDSDRQAIFSACLAELQNRPTIIVFEDIHWADEATLDIIKFLGRRIQRTPSLFILTYCDDELSADHPLRLVLGDLPPAATLLLHFTTSIQAICVYTGQRGGPGRTSQRSLRGDGRQSIFCDRGLGEQRHECAVAGFRSPRLRTLYSVSLRI